MTDCRCGVLPGHADPASMARTLEALIESERSEPRQAHWTYPHFTLHPNAAGSASEEFDSLPESMFSLRPGDVWVRLRERNGTLHQLPVSAIAKIEPGP